MTTQFFSFAKYVQQFFFYYAVLKVREKQSLVILKINGLNLKGRRVKSEFLSELCFTKTDWQLHDPSTSSAKCQRKLCRHIRYPYFSYFDQSFLPISVFILGSKRILKMTNQLSQGLELNFSSQNYVFYIHDVH